MKQGELADEYYWADYKATMKEIVYRSQIINTDTATTESQERVLIDFTKELLASHVKVPHSFVRFGALAARELFEKNTKVPYALKDCTLNECKAKALSLH